MNARQRRIIEEITERNQRGFKESIEDCYNAYDDASWTRVTLVNFFSFLFSPF